MSSLSELRSVNWGERIRRPRQTIQLVGKLARSVPDKLRSQNYEEYYLRHTKRDVDDPRAMVGPVETWDETLQWQKKQLFQRIGVSPTDTVVEVGCGVLRSGIPLIQTLDAGNYYGCDISVETLEAGWKRLEDADLAHKQPILWRNTHLDLGRGYTENVEADLVWAQSVVTHLPRARTRELFASLDDVLDDDGEAWITYYDGEVYQPKLQTVNFQYTVGELDEMAGDLTVEKVDDDGHPNGLDMVRVYR